MDGVAFRTEVNDAMIESGMRAKLENATSRFFKAARIDDLTSDLMNLHRLRLRTKELRYMTELCVPVLHDDFRATAYPIITQLQERLGKINDNSNAQKRLRKWKRDAASKQEARAYRKQMKLEKLKLRELINEFRTWWTPTLTSGLESMLNGSIVLLSDRSSSDDLPVTTQWYPEGSHILL